MNIHIPPINKLLAVRTLPYKKIGHKKFPGCEVRKWSPEVKQVLNLLT
jgi:hypothetical protein